MTAGNISKTVDHNTNKGARAVQLKVQIKLVRLWCTQSNMILDHKLNEAFSLSSAFVQGADRHHTLPS